MHKFVGVTTRKPARNTNKKHSATPTKSIARNTNKCTGATPTNAQ
jgi:hypothetical protein